MFVFRFKLFTFHFKLLNGEGGIGAGDEACHGVRERRSRMAFFRPSYKNYLAYSIARTSRTTLTLISPGYSRSASIFMEIFLANSKACKSLITSG